jgi:hypothetical protein
LAIIFCYEFKFDFTHNRIESIQFKEETMKAKIFVVLFAVLLLAGSLALAGDLKPYKGTAQQIASSDMTLDEALSYQFLADVIEARGEPYGMKYLTYQGINNVGGASINDGAQIYYFNSTTWAVEFYEVEAITHANGDQIYSNIEGVLSLITGSGTGTTTVVGGTGRFEGVGGWTEFTAALDSDGMASVVYKGQITTVGEAKKE